MDNHSYTFLQKRASDLIDWLKFVWTEYLRWFAFFCTLNITAIGALHFIDSAVQIYVKVVFCFFNGGGIVTAVVITIYTVDQIRSLSQINAALSEASSKDSRLSKFIRKPLVPFYFALWMGLAVFGALLLFATIWGYFLYVGNLPSDSSTPLPN